MEDIKNKRLIEELRFEKIALIEQNNSLQVLKDKAEKDLEQLKLIYNFSKPYCLVVDCNEKIVLINNNTLILLLQTTENVIGSPFDRYIVKKHLSNFKNFLRKAKQRKGNHSCNIELINAEGKNLSVNLSGSFLENEQQFLLTVIDQTKSNLIKNEDLARKFLLKQAERIGNIGTIKFDVSSGYATISEELSLIFGFKFEKIYKIEKWVTIIHPQDRETITEYLQECIVTKKAFRKEYRIIRENDGEVRWVDGWGENVFDDITQRFYLIGIIQDITERKLAFETIRNAQIRSHQIFESSKEGILILDAISGYITDINPFLIELIGFDYEELIGKELWEIGVFKNIAASKDAFIELQNKEYIRFEDMPLETKAGKVVAVEFVSNVYEVEQKKVILCHIRDISDRKKAEEASRESSELYFAMFEKNQAPQLLMNPVDLSIEDVNTAAAKFYGYSVEQLKVMNLKDISSKAAKEEMSKLKKSNLVEPSYSQYLHELYSGETREVEIYTTQLLIGKEVLLLCTINDITERKLKEEQLMELNKQLKELNTLKSQFVSTVSHEFRTPLAGILSSVQLLKIYADIWNKEKKEKMFKQIFDAVQHSTALLDDIALIDEEQTSKSFFRPTSIKLLPLIKEIIEENLSISGTIHEIVLKPDLSIESYTMDAVMIRHIFNNVISNAIKYSSETEKIVIFINEVASKEIKFEILDKGIGIPPDEIKNLSEPFYRASNVGKTKGTGFGFSIIKRFVTLHKGQIAVESVLNQGTKVIITLPYL
jgi:PAS domain S-box-containing protein